MSYSDLFIKKEKKIPIVFLLPPLLITIFFFNIFFNKSILPSRALSNFPRQIKILKITENRAIIFWETGEREISYLLFGESEKKINQIVLDDRDSQSLKTKRFFHIVTLNNLKPNQENYFRIVTEKKIFNNLNGKPFTFKFEPNIGRVFTSLPLYGKVLGENTRMLPETILIFSINQEPVGITTGKSNGDWLVVLRRFNKSFNNDEIVTLEIYTEDKNKTVVRGKIKDFSPLTIPITFGKNYDLTTVEKNVLSSSASKKNQDIFLIVYPKNKALIPGSRPIIKGWALPGKEVNVILKSRPIFSFKTKADKNGQWQVNIDFDLLPGDYQLDANSLDDRGNKLEQTVAFKIIKSGEQVLGEATPSATLIPSPTITPTIIPTIFPTNTPIISPTIYKTGNFNSYLYGVLAIFFMLTGFFLIIAHR